MNPQPGKDINWSSEIGRLRNNSPEGHLLALAVECARSIDPTGDMDSFFASAGMTAYKYKIYTESLAAGLLLRAGEHRLAQPFIRSLNNFLSAGSEAFSGADLAECLQPLMHGAIEAERFDLVQACTHCIASRLQQLRETEDEVPPDFRFSSIVAHLTEKQYFEMADKLLEAFEVRGKQTALSTAALKALECDSPQVVSWVLNRSASHLEAMEDQLGRFDGPDNIEEHFDLLASAVVRLQLKQGLMADAEDTINQMRSTATSIGEALGEYAAFSLKFWAEKKDEKVALAAVQQVVENLIEEFLPKSSRPSDKNQAISSFIRSYLKGCSKNSHFAPILPLVSEIDEGLSHGRTMANIACLALNIGEHSEFTDRWRRLGDFLKVSPQRSAGFDFYNQSVLIGEIARVISITVQEQSRKQEAYGALVDLASTLQYVGENYNHIAGAVKEMVQNNCVDEAKRLSSFIEDGEAAKLWSLSSLAEASASRGDTTAALKYFDDAASQVASVLLQAQIKMDQSAPEADTDADVEDTPTWDIADDAFFDRQNLNRIFRQLAANFDVTLEYCREFGTFGGIAARVGLHEKAGDFFSAAMEAASKVEVTSRPVAYYVTALSAVTGFVKKPEW
jgi:hypothetical protein